MIAFNSRDIAIFKFWHLGLKLPIHALFWGGGWCHPSFQPPKGTFAWKHVIWAIKCVHQCSGLTCREVDSTVGRNFHFHIDFWMAITTVQHYCTASDCQTKVKIIKYTSCWWNVRVNIAELLQMRRMELQNYLSVLHLWGVLTWVT